jgi:hypothetical protein
MVNTVSTISPPPTCIQTSPELFRTIQYYSENGGILFLFKDLRAEYYFAKEMQKNPPRYSDYSARLAFEGENR